MKSYKIIDVLGDFELLIDHKVYANNDEEAKKQIMKEISNNIDNYLYSVVEVEE